MCISKSVVGLSVMVLALCASAGTAAAAIKVDVIGGLKSGQCIDVKWRTADGQYQGTREYAGTDGIARVNKPEGAKDLEYKTMSGVSMQTLNPTGDLFITDQLDLGNKFPLFGLSEDNYLGTAITLGEFDASRAWIVGETAVFTSGLSSGLPGLIVSMTDGTLFTGTATVHAVNEVVPAPGTMVLLTAAGLCACRRRR